MSNEWRTRLDPKTYNDLVDILTKILPHKKAYEEAKNSANAQLWLALIELSRENRNLKDRIEKLEHVLEHTNGNGYPKTQGNPVKSEKTKLLADLHGF